MTSVVAAVPKHVAVDKTTYGIMSPPASDDEQCTAIGSAPITINMNTIDSNLLPFLDCELIKAPVTLDSDYRLPVALTEGQPATTTKCKQQQQPVVPVGKGKKLSKIKAAEERRLSLEARNTALKARVEELEDKVKTLMRNLIASSNLVH
jgi:hypothetical protein